MELTFTSTNSAMSDKVDFFITATERQRSIMLDQFNKYTPFTPHIVTIPVGSVDKLRKPEGERKPFSIITASRWPMKNTWTGWPRLLLRLKKVCHK